MKVSDFLGQVRGMLDADEAAPEKLARLGAFVDGVQASLRQGAVKDRPIRERAPRVPRATGAARATTPRNTRRRADGHDTRIPPVGSVIRRGKHEVTVLANGQFEFDGKAYKGISGPAAAIRNGAPTSGFELFKLGKLPAEFTGEEDPCVVVEGVITEGGQPQGAPKESLVATVGTPKASGRGSVPAASNPGDVSDGAGYAAHAMATDDDPATATATDDDPATATATAPASIAANSPNELEEQAEAEEQAGDDEAGGAEADDEDSGEVAETEAADAEAADIAAEDPEEDAGEGEAGAEDPEEDEDVAGIETEAGETEAGEGEAGAAAEVEEADEAREEAAKPAAKKKTTAKKANPKKPAKKPTTKGKKASSKKAKAKPKAKPKAKKKGSRSR